MSGISRNLVLQARSLTPRNRIFVIRHGESEANVANLIVSSPENGIHEWRLTERGKMQAQEACLKLQDLVQSDTDDHSDTRNILDNLSHSLIFVSSDFRRTRETAEIMQSHFSTEAPVRFEPRLRERDFGVFNMTNSSNYHRVWEEDLKDPSHTSYSCESVSSVFSRTFQLIRELDDEYKEKVIALISHGDTLQITLTAYAHLEPNKHRQLPGLGNCDIVELKTTAQN